MHAKLVILFQNFILRDFSIYFGIGHVILYQFFQALFKTFILNIIDLKFNVAVFYIIEGSFLVGQLYLKGQPHAFLDYDKGF